MKLLLVGPYPPPHGGISVHVASAQRMLLRAGASCRVLDCGGHRQATAGPRGRVAGRLRLLEQIRDHARAGFTVHVHGNGHSTRSWLLLLACGYAGRGAQGRVLTLHSGLVPRFLDSCSVGARSLVRVALRAYDRVLCVNDSIHGALAPLHRARPRIETLPAYLEAPRPDAALASHVEEWLAAHTPVLSTALFFRPEYGFELLVDATARLRATYPRLGCLVLGGDAGSDAAQELLRLRGLAAAVLLAGDVEHERCLAAMARSDVFVRATLADGDASSVREALALGVPVVASDVGHRPVGVALFRRGEVESLVAAIESQLDRRAPHGPRAPEPGDGLRRLLETYREVRGA